jgi:hypothetical protein
MHSVSDLTTFSRKTSGEVPPKLVVRTIPSQSTFGLFTFYHLQGASTTVVGDKVYLYVRVSPIYALLLSYLAFIPQGGRLVTERRMVTDMYVFDLKTLIWEKIVAPTDDSTPAQRYFHSADSCEPKFPLN